MNLKYNGWLIGVLVAVTAVLDAVFNPQRRARTALLRTFGFGMVGAGLAIVMYLPWYQFVERNGGYAGLVAHHRSYLGGPATWLPHWHQQLANIKALSGTPYWPLAAWCLGCSGLGLVIWNRDSLWENKTGRVWLITALGYGGIVFAIWPTSGWWMPLLALPWVLSLGSSARLLGVGWLTLSVMTPFYHPYARLWLPLHAFSWLIVGGGLREVWIVSLGNVPAVGNSRNSRGTWTLGIVLAALLSAAFEMTGVTRPSPLPNPNGLYPISWTQSELANARTMYGPATGAIHVYARPSVLFYLMTTAKQPIYRSTSAEAALMSSNPADYTLLDTAVFTAEDFDKVSMAPSFGWQQPLSPVSWLDVDPAAAYGQTTRSRAQLIFWATSLIRNHVGLGRPVATPPITPASPSAP